MDLVQEVEPNAQAYQPLDSIQEEEIKDSSTQNESRISTQQPVSAEADNFDVGFFAEQKQKVKLNKGEKRALKFALAKGGVPEDPEQLKKFLEDSVANAKRSKGTQAAGGQTRTKGKQMMKVSDYSQLETNYKM